MPIKERPPVADSPWFWVLIFSLTALAALAAISGKYGRRQANMEVKYQARERIIEERAAGNNRQQQSRTDELAARRPFASPGNTLVPIWPLAAILVLVALVAYVMLYRGRTLHLPPSNESPPQ
jgi:hypothetical protein